MSSVYETGATGLIEQSEEAIIAAYEAEMAAELDPRSIQDLEEAHQSDIDAVIVAKAGGTSMARPEVTANQVENRPEVANVLVTSAAGKSKAHGENAKVTDMLLNHKEGGYDGVTDIKARYSAILKRTGMDKDPASLEIVDRIPDDISSWAAKGDPIEALGEYWSAKLYARQTGREFVDARGLIFFDAEGNYDEARSTTAIKAQLKPSGKYVVPGFYGSNPDGSIRTFERGGSDITGACIAKALSAKAYFNMSDVKGFYTANPSIVDQAKYLLFLTYGEARGLAAGGNELLHRQVGMQLGGTGYDTFMVDTFGPIGNIGTRVSDKRNTVDTVPIVGVTGREMLTVKMGLFGLNEGFGRTNIVYDTMEGLELPFERGHDGLDHLTLHFDPKKEDKVQDFADAMRKQGMKIRTAQTGLVHVVGEGLRDIGLLPIQTMGRICTALASEGIVGMGSSAMPGSAELSLYVDHNRLDEAVAAAHDALTLDQITAALQMQNR